MMNILIFINIMNTNIFAKLQKYNPDIESKYSDYKKIHNVIYPIINNGNIVKIADTIINSNELNKLISQNKSSRDVEKQNYKFNETKISNILEDNVKHETLKYENNNMDNIIINDLINLGILN